MRTLRPEPLLTVLPRICDDEGVQPTIGHPDSPLLPELLGQKPHRGKVSLHTDVPEMWIQAPHNAAPRAVG